MYLLLHRALRNAGDYLIFERARALIQAGRPDVPHLVGKAWLPLLDQFSPAQLAGCRAVVVCGGPGYAAGIRRLYPLAPPETLPPVVFLALGSAVTPGTRRQLAEHRYGDDDRAFLRGIASRSAYLGARDELTAELLRREGIGDVLMTGDPAWYDLGVIAADSHGAPSSPSPALGTVAFTPPANPVYFAQALRLLEALARARPRGALTVVFHRGVQRPFAALAQRTGSATLDITGSAGGFAVYDRLDGHVGYRVHAHLYSLSHRRPSYLLAEDSRGTGVHRTLGELGGPAFDAERGDSPLMLRAMRLMPRLGNPHRPVTAPLGPLLARPLRLPEVTRSVLDQIDSDRAAGFPRHAAAWHVIRATLPQMQRMVDSLP
jgi:hypothetical protein